jgi:3D (Asp-Asp-Asp) domain-containing protein
MRALLGIAAAFCILSAAVLHGDDAAKRSRRPRSIRVVATAYCHSGKTQSGIPTRSGIVAADPRMLPLGSVVRILDGPTTGIYTVMDTGAAIKGRRIDVYVPNCARAKKFGRRTVTLTVIEQR